MFSKHLSPQPEYASPRWLHLWAVLTVLLTFPLLLLGAEVTSKGVGMVDPNGHSHIREPWILIRQWHEGPLVGRGLGYVIEHSHRLVGLLVGTSTIILAIGLWFGERRWWLRLLGVTALLAVIGQGMLGIFRVDLHALLGRNLALIHGCTAQLVFALLVSIAVFTSRSWSRPVTTANAAGNKTCARLSIVVLLLVFAQLVLGGLVRHHAWSLAGRIHVLAAFAVTAAVVWLMRETLARPAVTRQEIVTCCLLGGLLLAQVYLGMESWLTRFRGADVFGTAQAAPLALDHSVLRSLHYVTGSLVFATVVVLSLWANRPVTPQTSEVCVQQQDDTGALTPVHARHLEGVA